MTSPTSVEMRVTMANPDRSGPRHLATFCGKCSCGCPEVFIDADAPAARRVIITDDFGQRVEMSLDQFGDLVDQARSGRLDTVVLAGSG